jgi:hypothetical protein
MGYNWGLRAASIGAGVRLEKPAKNRGFTTVFGYCLEAVQRPVHPSDRVNEPEPVRPEKRPELVQLKPCTDPPVLVAPLGLTNPELSSPEILPPEMTNLSVALPQGVPTATETHEPSKLPPLPPPSPPLLRDAPRGSSDSGLARRAGFEGSTVRGFSREPDSDFSSLPALPDCHSVALLRATGITSERRPILIERRAEYSIMTCSDISRPWRATALLFRRCPPSGAAVRLPERPAAGAARQPAGGDDRDALVGGCAVHRSVRAEGASRFLANESCRW